MNFGKNLNFLRVYNKESQEDLAKIVNKKRSLISAWENNERSPKVEDFLLLCKHYNVEIQDMYEKDLAMEYAKKAYSQEEIARNEFFKELQELISDVNLNDEKKKYIKKTIKMIMEDDE